MKLAIESAHKTIGNLVLFGDVRWLSKTLSLKNFGHECTQEWNFGFEIERSPTIPSATLAFQNPSHYVPQLHKLLLPPDLESLKLKRVGRRDRSKEKPEDPHLEMSPFPETILIFTPFLKTILCQVTFICFVYLRLKRLN